MNSTWARNLVKVNLNLTVVSTRVNSKMDNSKATESTTSLNQANYTKVSS